MTPLQIRSESLDLEAALRFHGSIKRLKHQAQKIQLKYHIYLTMINEAADLSDAQKLEEVAKQMVDTLTPLSPPAALDLTLQLERQGRFNTLTDTKQTINDLKTELNRLQKTISDL